MTRDELLSYLRNGRFATVSFIMRGNGQPRVMNCRYGVKKDLSTTGNPPPYADEDFELVTVYDLQKRAYRKIPADRVYEIKANKQIMKVSHEGIVAVSSSTDPS